MILSLFSHSSATFLSCFWGHVSPKCFSLLVVPWIYVMCAQSICRYLTECLVSVLAVRFCGCNLSSHLCCLFVFNSSFCFVNFRNVRIRWYLCLTLQTDLLQGGTGCFPVGFSCHWWSSHLRLCTYHRTVCSLGVKGLFNVLKALRLRGWCPSPVEEIEWDALSSQVFLPELCWFSAGSCSCCREDWCLDIFIWHSVQLHCAHAKELTLAFTICQTARA